MVILLLVLGLSMTSTSGQEYHARRELGNIFEEDDTTHTRSEHLGPSSSSKVTEQEEHEQQQQEEYTCKSIIAVGNTRIPIIHHHVDNVVNTFTKNGGRNLDDNSSTSQSSSTNNDNEDLDDDGEQFLCELYDGSTLPITATVDQMNELRMSLNNGTLISSVSSVTVVEVDSELMEEDSSVVDADSSAAAEQAESTTSNIPSDTTSTSSSPSSPNNTNNHYEWYMNWDILKCRPICIGAYPCQDTNDEPLAPWTIKYNTSKECCIDSNVHEQCGLWSVSLPKGAIQLEKKDPHERHLLVSSSSSFTAKEKHQQGKEHEQPITTRRRRSLASYTGTKTTLVVRVTDINGIVISDSPSTISNKIFGTYGDEETLSSQFSSCSYSTFNIVPILKASYYQLSDNGVLDVTIPISINNKQHLIRNAVTHAVELKLGIQLPGIFDFVIYVLEGCYQDCGWAGVRRNIVSIYV